MHVLAFGVGQGPRTFTKLLKVPLTFLMRLMIKIVAYLDNSLNIGSTEGEAIRAIRGTLCYSYFRS